MSAWIAALAVVGLWAWFAFGFHFKHYPTPDELYGCSVEQADPASGECK